ncbi:MAG: hypothetical protein ACTSSJ_00155 [Candidatus Odinarchaeia archaeon]
MSSIYEEVKEKFEKYGDSLLKSRKIRTLLKLIGAVSLNFEITDTREKFSAKISSGNVVLSKNHVDKPNVVIRGTSEIYRKLLSTISEEMYKEIYSSGLLEIEAHGLKGKMVVSKVKKMFNL